MSEPTDTTTVTTPSHPNYGEPDYEPNEMKIPIIQPGRLTTKPKTKQSTPSMWLLIVAIVLAVGGLVLGGTKVYTADDNTGCGTPFSMNDDLTAYGEDFCNGAAGLAERRTWTWILLGGAGVSLLAAFYVSALPATKEEAR